MSPDNMAASRRVLEEAFNQGNLEVIDEVCSDDFVDHVWRELNGRSVGIVTNPSGVTSSGTPGSNA